jgi:hypothetical protein
MFKETRNGACLSKSYSHSQVPSCCRLTVLFRVTPNRDVIDQRSVEYQNERSNQPSTSRISSEAARYGADVSLQVSLLRLHLRRFSQIRPCVRSLLPFHVLVTHRPRAPVPDLPTTRPKGLTPHIHVKYITDTSAPHARHCSHNNATTHPQTVRQARRSLARG